MLRPKLSNKSKIILQLFLVKIKVPPTESNASRTAKFQINNNSSQVAYWINTIGLKKITRAHIHNGTAEHNSDPIVILKNGDSAKGSNALNLIRSSGNITKSDLQGPLKGKEVSDLSNLMSNGSAYVNAHTDEYPEGAIRGHITSGDVDMQEMCVPEDTNDSSSKK